MTHTRLSVSIETPHQYWRLHIPSSSNLSSRTQLYRVRDLLFVMPRTADPSQKAVRDDRLKGCSLAGIAGDKSKSVDFSYIFKHSCISINNTAGVYMRDASINLRVKPEQRDLIDQAAAALGRNRSDFIMSVACERAQAVLIDRVFFTVNAERMEKFMSLLDTSTDESVRGMEKLMAVKPIWLKQTSLG
jgi:uncharacterized protein (DUF1778 family)